MTRQRNKAEYRDERAADPEDEWDGRRSRTDVRRRSGKTGNTGNRRRRRRRDRRKARIHFLASMLGTLLGAVLLVLVAYTALNLFFGFGKVNIQKLRDQGYPESLISLVERNPETKDFVLDYPKYKGLQDIDLSKEVTKGEIPHFLQWDKRWGYETYGSDFLAITGCGPTCLSMVVCGLTGETQWNPYEVAKMAEDEDIDGVGDAGGERERHAQGIDGPVRVEKQQDAERAQKRAEQRALFHLFPQQKAAEHGARDQRLADKGADPAENVGRDHRRKQQRERQHKAPYVGVPEMHSGRHSLVSSLFSMCRFRLCRTFSKVFSSSSE